MYERGCKLRNLLSTSRGRTAALAGCATFRRSDRKRRINEIRRRGKVSFGRKEEKSLSSPFRNDSQTPLTEEQTLLAESRVLTEIHSWEGGRNQTKSLVDRETLPTVLAKNQEKRRKGEIMRARLHATTFNNAAQTDGRTDKGCVRPSLSLSIVQILTAALRDCFTIYGKCSRCSFARLPPWPPGLVRSLTILKGFLPLERRSRNPRLVYGTSFTLSTPTLDRHEGRRARDTLRSSSSLFVKVG